MVRSFSMFFLILFILAGCGGSSSKNGLSELSLDNGSDPTPSSKSYKPSANLTKDQEQLLTNLKKQHYQTEVALVELPADDSFESLSNYLGFSDDGSIGGEIIDPIVVADGGSSNLSEPVKSLKKLSSLSDLMTTVQISGSLQNFSISKVEGDKIYFAQYYYYYFIRPTYKNDFPAIFLRINDSNKSIEKVLSDDKELVFHVYGDNKTIGLTTPKGKLIQIELKDATTGATSTLELAFDDSIDKDIFTMDGVANTTGAENTLDSTAPTSSDDTGAGDATREVDFTDTNNQVEGISEADHVKTDGSYIYSLLHNELKIYDISQEDFIATLSIDFTKFGFETNAVLEKNKNAKDIAESTSLLYVQYVSSEINLVSGNIVIFSQYGGKTIVSYVDISDKSAPTLTKQLTFNESLVSSRIVDNKVIMVLNDYLYPTEQIEIPYHYAFTAEQQAKFTVANEALVKDLTLADFSMDTSFEQSSGSASENVSYLDAENIYFDTNSGGYSLSKILVLDADAAVVSANGVLTDYTENIYVTAKSVFLFNTTWESRIEWWNFDWIGAQNTMIYHFDISNSELNYKGGVEVSGRPHGTFSFHEAGTNLFMAFHDDTTDENGIHTISLGDELTKSNTLGGIATGESLQSVRFIDDKAYLVTFKNVDPLFIIDLANPISPVVLGELKASGFSSYLHLVFEDVLLGVGFEADEEGAVSGAKINTFNVSSNTPTEIDKAGITGSYPYFNASYDHHAFTWYKSQNLLALPYSGDKSGAIVYRLDVAGNILEAAVLESPNTTKEFTYYSSNSGRIIFVDDTLYYVDGGFIKPYPISSLTFTTENKNVTIESSNVGVDDGLVIFETLETE